MILLCLLRSSALSSAPVCPALQWGAKPNGLLPEPLPSAFWLACPMGGSSKEGGRHGERSQYLCPPAPACLATVLAVSLPVARAPISCSSLFPFRLWSSNDFPLFHCYSLGTSGFLLLSALRIVFLVNSSWLKLYICKCLGP